MKAIRDLLTAIAYRYYPIRWYLVLGLIVTPLVGGFIETWLTTGLSLIAMPWIYLFLCIIVSFGPIRFFKESPVIQYWRPIAPIFIAPVLLLALFATVAVPYVFVASFIN